MIEFLKIMLEGKKAKMDERGASAVEYGLLVAGIAAVIVASCSRSVATSTAASPTPATRSSQSLHRGRRLVSRCTVTAGRHRLAVHGLRLAPGSRALHS